MLLLRLLLQAPDAVTLGLIVAAVAEAGVDAGE
jgi:hypothetical protein